MGLSKDELHRCIETEKEYLLLVRWESIEAHEVGFRRSSQYQEWKRLLHHFYDPFPTVFHFAAVQGACSPVQDTGPKAQQVGFARVPDGRRHGTD